jgi:hypothetical protein
MGFLSKLIGGGATAPIEAIGNVIGKVYEGKNEKLSHEEVMAAIAQNPQMWQAEIGKIEAQHRSIFVAGWRPFIGWVCGTGLGFVFVFNPVIQWITGQAGPSMPTEAMMTLVVSLLGLAGYRTVEKVSGAAK